MIHEGRGLIVLSLLFLVMDVRNQDRLGRKFGETYSLILTDLNFEKRLKHFDPNLKLMFNKVEKKWVILEWAPDGSGWNILFKCEDDQKKPKGVGEWVFNKLFVMRNNYEYRKSNPDRFFDDLLYYGEKKEEERELKASEEHKSKLLDDRNLWRKAARELRNEAPADVTAGYPKKGKKYANSSQNVQRHA